MKSFSSRWMVGALGIVGLVALQVATLFWFGQPFISMQGYVKLWEGVVLGPGNSQHLSDWYTFSHIIHGFIFYWLLTLVAPRLPVGIRLLIALGIEVAWEVLENTPMVINHYRQQALAQGYTGDSIINSVSDSVAMLLGFLWARRMPVHSTILLALGLEAFTLYYIRDSLTLNVLNLIHQFTFISDWQSGS
jgi:hypothetical protein